MTKLEEVLAEEWETHDTDVVYCGHVKPDQRAFAVFGNARYRAQLVSDADTDEEADLRAAVAVLGKRALKLLVDSFAGEHMPDIEEMAAVVADARNLE